MFISFIGSPCSGKTTIAASVFAYLKEIGFTVEFINEQARTYIAKKKFETKSHQIKLTDEDQFNIIQMQVEAETYFEYASDPYTVIITDSSVLNSLLYMSDDARYRSTRPIQVACERYDHVFYPTPVPLPISNDPNRIHSAEDIRLIHDSIPQIIATHAPDLHMTPLSGPLKARVQEVISIVIEGLGKCS